MFSYLGRNIFFILLFVLTSVSSFANTGSYDMGREFRSDKLIREQNTKGEQIAWFNHGTPVSCPMGTGLGDGCPGTGGLFLVQNYNGGQNCFSGYLKGLSTWATSAGVNWNGTRPKWNVPGCDYPIGSNTDWKAVQTNPATYSQSHDPYYTHPANCTLNTGISGWANPWWPYSTANSRKMNYLNCTGGFGTTMLFKDMYFGSQGQGTAFAHNAVAIKTDGAADLYFQNVVFSSEQANSGDTITWTGTGPTISWGMLYYAGALSTTSTPTNTGTVTFDHVTALGNFQDGSNCCDIQNNTMFGIVTNGNLVITYSAFYNFAGYVLSFTPSRTVSGNARGSFQMDHSYLDGCTQNIASGHTECFAGNGATANRTEQYSVFKTGPLMPSQQTFFHANSGGGTNPNTNMTINNNLYLANANGLSLTGSVPISFHLTNGILMLDSAPASQVKAGVIVNGANLQILKQNGTDIHGYPTFTTSCGGSQVGTLQCPGMSFSFGQNMKACINNSTPPSASLCTTAPANGQMSITNFYCIISCPQLGGNAGIPSNPPARVLTQLSGGTWGGAGTYTINQSLTVGSVGSPTTFTVTAINPSTGNNLTVTVTGYITGTTMVANSVSAPFVINTLTDWTGDGSSPVLPSGTRIVACIDGTGDAGGIAQYIINKYINVSSKDFLVSVGAGQDWITGSIAQNADGVTSTLTVTNFKNLWSSGETVTGVTGQGSSVILGSLVSGDQGGVALVNVSTPLLSTALTDMAPTTGLYTDPSNYLNPTTYPPNGSPVNMFLDTKSMNWFFDLYYVPMNGTFDMHDNFFDAIGILSTDGSGIAYPASCPTGYVNTWTAGGKNNYNLYTLSGTASEVTTFGGTNPGGC